MPNTGDGSKTRDRAKCLLQALLACEAGESNTVIQQKWYSNEPFFKATLGQLVKLANEYYKNPEHNYEYGQKDEFNGSKIREAINKLKKLEILADKHKNTRGRPQREFTLKLSSEEKAEYYEKLDEKWKDLLEKKKDVRLIEPGRYLLECLGHFYSEKRFLNGIPIELRVNLASNVEGNSGIIWDITYDKAASAYRFECCSNLERSGFLNGLTAVEKPRAIVVSSTGDEFSGINWRAEPYKIEENVFRFECLSKEKGPCWLNGNTYNATVDLIDANFKDHTGTKWKVERVSDNREQ